MLRSSIFLLGVGLLVLALPNESLQAQSGREDFVRVTDQMLQDPAPEDWLMWRRTLDSWGYSPLDQINRENVRGLRIVWTCLLYTSPSPRDGLLSGMPSCA